MRERDSCERGRSDERPFLSDFFSKLYGFVQGCGRKATVPFY